MYSPDMYTFMQQNSTRFTLGDEVLETFMVDPGIGTSCMADVNLGYPYKCVTPASKFSVPPHNASADGRCFCQDDEYKCEGSPYGAPPPQRVTTTTEILQNLNNRDINKYLLDSFPEFIGKRYGGWSFEDESKEANANLKAKIWYYNKGYHTLPSFFNAYSNGLLRALVNDESEAPK
ncbi:glucosylceramide transporter ABCA12-like [Ruditapes philippinarum]|uniref:glucosylceramide transporter ABCA12-like n=1 Tax=Ruditapes philippinarum TaxID=129788 RepID=UPI00295B19F5|nr:glucosylceramide transporter ABCA12-like [Ruditapes philippinarum]